MSDFRIYGSTSRLTWVTDIMSACSLALNPHNNHRRQHYCQNIANCFYNSVDEVAKANIAARSTMVSLWPAMISLVSALYPDAADVAHVHLGWAAMFALTSGGIAGYSLQTPRGHHFAPSEELARKWCEGTVIPVKAGSPARERKSLHLVSLGLLLCAAGVYATFAALFLNILKKTILTWLCEPYWFGALWFFLCSVPALLQAARQVLFTSNTTLYATNKDAALPFKKLEKVGNIGMWMRVLKYQFTNTPYRLLVQKPEESLASGLFDTLIATGRLAVFVFGSVTQCSLILMPTPLDGLLFGLIVATAFVPRVLWMKICARAVHNDTWVVFYERSDVSTER
jgi:hypothetical protein